MEAILNGIASALGAVMDVCYSVCKNYGLAIILFTLISKIILLPISIWVHYNGIKMVRMMPKINWLHVNHYGDRDAIAEGQAKLYKEEKYSPLAVDFSRMLKYCLKKNTGFEIELENKEDVYLLINRIYQQYKSEHSLEKPYVTVVKGSFDLMYDGL